MGDNKFFIFLPGAFPVLFKLLLEGLQLFICLGGHSITAFKEEEKENTAGKKSQSQ